MHREPRSLPNDRDSKLSTQVRGRVEPPMPPLPEGVRAGTPRDVEAHDLPQGDWGAAREGVGVPGGVQECLAQTMSHLTSDGASEVELKVPVMARWISSNTKAGGNKCRLH
jgi:hypothetical protein